MSERRHTSTISELRANAIAALIMMAVVTLAAFAVMALVH
jgi:hypothetical protein